MPALELYGSTQCPYTQELREWLEWNRRDYLEYNVDTDPHAYARLQAITGGSGTVPVLVDEGRVIQVGWQGRCCHLGGAGNVRAACADQRSEPK
jgi:glutaredoxin